MKACESYIDLMMCSIDRETTPQEEAELQNHLAQCERCRALYETYRALDAGLQATEEEPPENLTRAVMNGIHAEQQERSPKHLLKRFRFTAIAAAAAILVLVFARFQPDVTSVTRDSVNTSGNTEAAVPQVEAEFIAPADVPEAQEPSLARSGEILEDAVEEAAVEECAPEEPETTMEPADGDAATVTAAEADFGEINLSKLAESLHAMGLPGDVLLISGMTGEELTALFPKSSAITLETGEILYEVPAEEAELSITAGELAVSERCPDDSASEKWYCIVSD